MVSIAISTPGSKCLSVCALCGLQDIKGRIPLAYLQLFHCQSFIYYYAYKCTYTEFFQDPPTVNFEKERLLQSLFYLVQGRCLRLASLEGESVNLLSPTDYRGKLVQVSRCASRWS